MIQIDDIHIEEFRGIRDLRLRFNSKSFVILGPNGVGKSGVVDALDFAFTGSVSRLMGHGSGGVTLKAHGPHIHQRRNANAARVSVTVRDPGSGETATLRRSVKTPATYSLTPESAELRQAIDRISQHPEITLSRREIIKFIITEPGKRSEMVQALLRLDHVGQIRTALHKTRADLSRDAKTTASAVDTTNSAVKRHFDVLEFDTDYAITAINRHRSVLGLDRISDLDPDGITAEVTAQRTAPYINISRDSAIRDVDALLSQLLVQSAIADPLQELTAIVDRVVDDAQLAQDLSTTLLVESGIDLLIDEACPLCDYRWPHSDSLRQHLTDKLTRLGHAFQTRDEILQATRSFVDSIFPVRNLGTTVRRIASELENHTAAQILDSWLALLDDFRSQILSIDGIFRLWDSMIVNPLRVPSGLADALGSLKHDLHNIPDTNATTEAVQFLSVASDRLASFIAASQAHAPAEEASAIADAVYRAYCSAQDHVLDGYYERVQADFIACYRQLNDDESNFTAELKQTEGKLNLRVDFYGQDMVPPGAYHSEGHQDAMGLCLYLVLMKQRLSTDFRLAILDDVVMSIDSGHRRAICNLLESRFADVQFIVTTHDPVWARQLRETGVVPQDGHVVFPQWSVDSGPVGIRHADFWNDIDLALEKNDIGQAASRLRYSLEQELTTLANRFRYLVPFREDGQYSLGELADSVVGGFNKLLRKAANVVNSRNDSVADAGLAALKARWQESRQQVQVEQWTVNPAVHYNLWATFSRQDFVPVVAAWRGFLSVFECTECASRLFVTKNNMEDISLRCDERHIDLDLKV